MKIALFSTFDNGGAGRAALRLHNGLIQIGEDSTLFVKKKTTDNAKVAKLDSPELCNKTLASLQKNFSNISPENTMCSAMYPGLNCTNLEKVRSFDIINLHWIPSLVSLEDISQMHTMGKPIVWTLHDQNPMTGACHYTHGCEKYKSDCLNCPQLKNDQSDLAAAVLKDKVKLLPKNLVVVTPSRWLADCAKKSTVFKNHRIEVIPYSLETDLYLPINKRSAKQQLRLPSSAKVILFGATDLKEKRKGLSELIQVSNHLRTNSAIKTLIKANQFYLLVFGYESPLLHSIGIPYKNVGYISQTNMLSLVYSAADVLALPSLEDNLPNIMLESLACGTPVVAFSTGGMQDTIINGKNGFLVSLTDTKSFANRLIDSIQGYPMEKYCRQFAEENYRLDIQAQKYRKLYQRLL